MHNEARLLQPARMSRLDQSAENFHDRRFDVATYADNFPVVFKGDNALSVVLRFDPFIARFPKRDLA